MTKRIQYVHAFLFLCTTTFFSSNILLAQESQSTQTEADSLLNSVTALRDTIQSAKAILDAEDPTRINPDLSDDEFNSLMDQLSECEDSAAKMRGTLMDKDHQPSEEEMDEMREESSRLFDKLKKLTAQAFIVDPADEALSDSLLSREGTLNTNDISISLRGRGLLIKLTPIDDEVLQYCSPDVRKTFTTLRRNQEDLQYYYPHTDLRMFYVIFQSTEDGTRYEPDEIEIEHQGNIFRPIDILPLTDDFDLQVLEKKYLSLANAIYLFDASIDYFEPLIFFYQNDLQNNRWSAVIRRLDNERRKFKATSLSDGQG